MRNRFSYDSTGVWVELECFDGTLSSTLWIDLLWILSTFDMDGTSSRSSSFSSDSSIDPLTLSSFLYASMVLFLDNLDDLREDFIDYFDVLDYLDFCDY